MTNIPSPYFPTAPNITFLSGESVGLAYALVNQQTPASAAWPSANRAIYVPFSIRESITVISLFVVNGATAAGNFDIGIYSQDGARIVSLGSTVQTGTSTIQNTSITATRIGPGRFYLALVLSSASGTVFTWNSGVTGVTSNTVGIYSQTTALPLPASATFATAAGSAIPIFGLSTVPIV